MRTTADITLLALPMCYLSRFPHTYFLLQAMDLGLDFEDDSL